MFRLQQKKKEDAEKKKQEADKPGFQKQVSVRTRFLTRGRQHQNCSWLGHLLIAMLSCAEVAELELNLPGKYESESTG